MTSLAGGHRSDKRRADVRRLSTAPGDPRIDTDPHAALGLRGLIDLALVLALTGVALYGFRSTFSGHAYLVAGLVGAVLGVAVASLVSVARRPAWLAAVLVVMVYFVSVGVLVFRAETTAGFLPNAQVLHDAATVLADGWKQLLTTLPPVTSSGRLVAIPYVLGLLSGAIAAVTAQRTATRFAPALAPVVTLAAVILLGTAQPAARVWQGIAFGCLVVGWAAIRRPGARPLTVKVTPGSPQRLVIGLAILALAGGAAAVLEPQVTGHERHRVVLRDYVKPPFDIAAYPSPLVGFRKYTKSANLLFDQTLFTVQGLRGATIVRLATLDAYDGSVWGATNGTVSTGSGQPLDAFQRVGSQVAVPGAGRAAEASFSIKAPYAAARDINAWVPGVGALRSIDFRGPRAHAHDEAFRYNLATGSGITSARLAAGDTYAVHGVGHDGSLPKDATPYGAPTLDPSADAFVAGRATQWSARAPDVMAQVEAVARYLRDNGAYSDGGPGEAQYLPGHSAGRLTAFLNAPQLVGDDEQYAAAYALICNYLGLPARVVLLAEPQADGAVQGKNVHTAVEVHIRSHAITGWVTIARKTFMPDENKKPNKQPPQTTQDAAAAVVPPPNPVHPPSTLDEPDRPDQNTQRLGKPPQPAHGVLSGWFGTVVLYVGLPIFLLALLCALIIGIKWRRRVLRRTRGSIPNRFDAGWREFVDAARDLGAVVPRGRTRNEQAVVLTERPAGERAEKLAAAADHGVFGPGDPPAEAAADYWRHVDAARRAMARDAGRLGRLRAALNLRSIRSPTRAARA
ncbi:MAG: transglutaminase domain-containing protein [Jatrophihabitans sp.]